MRNFFVSLWRDYKSWRYERRCLKYFGCKPETIYISKEAYDEIQKRLAEPPDPKSIEKLKQLLERRAPWDE
jgi:hypothetical protein